MIIVKTIHKQIKVKKTVEWTDGWRGRQAEEEEEKKEKKEEEEA